MLGRLRTTVLEHAPHFLPALFADTPGFPRLQELSREGRQQGTLTLTLITERSSFASWALGHLVRPALFFLVLPGLSTGGSLASSRFFYHRHPVTQVLTSFPSILLIWGHAFLPQMCYNLCLLVIPREATSLLGRSIGAK